MKKIAIINTGGTIAMAVDEESQSVKPADQQAFRSLLPYLTAHAEITMNDFLNIPSPHMTPQKMLSLAEEITSYLQQEDIDGVVVTHGTDTLEETAYFLELVLQSEKPVIITGAMRSSNELSADGPVNLVHSVRVAAEPSSKGRGTLVVFNDEIHAAHHVTKTHTSNVSTFQSPQHGPIGLITNQKITYHQPPMERQHFPINHANANVPLVKVVAGMSPEWIQFLLADDIDGVVVEAFGQGNVPPAIMPVLEKLIQQKKPVVIISRCHNGFVQDTYGYAGGGRQLKEIGVILSNGLNGQKARIKLLIALEHTQDLAQLEEIFAS